MNPLFPRNLQFGIIAGGITLLLLGSSSLCLAHGGVTPYDVLGKMKRQGTGPYSKILKNRRFSEDWLGIQGEDTGNGIRIMAVKPGGVAEEASFVTGDIIIGINSQPIRSLDELDAFLYNIEPAVFTFHYLRDNEETSENIYLDGTLAEVDPEMTDMLRKQDGFKPGMLMDEMMARSPMGSMKKQGFVPPMLRSGNNRGETMPMDPASIMQQMMSRTPLGNFSGNPPAAAPSPAQDTSTSLLSFPSAPTSPLVKSGLKTLEEELLALPQIISKGREFGLSGQQAEALRKLDLERKKFSLRNDSLLTVARMDLKDELTRDRIDEKKAMELVAKVNDFNRSRFLKWLELWDRMNKILRHSKP